MTYHIAITETGWLVVGVIEALLGLIDGLG